VDILVLNASVQIRNAWENITVDEFDFQMRVNLYSTLALIQACVPGMREKHWGRIVTIGSVQQYRPNTAMAVYAASKAGIRNLVLTLSVQLAADGININNVAPGCIETIRNAVVTNSITQEAMCQHTQEVYRKVMDSNTIELMETGTRRLLTLLLKAGITGDQRWLGDVEVPHVSETAWRQLLVYADHENVRAVVDRGLHAMGIRAPYIETAHIKSYLPTAYQLPKVENRTVVGIISEMHHGPLTLRQLVELDRALRRDDADDEKIVDQLTEMRLIRYFRHILQLLTEQTLLDEGFLPASPIDDKQTIGLRRQLFTHLRI
jgi:hypothetical protein